MKPRITLITLGVDDLERAVAFYRDGLGLPTQGIVGAEIETVRRFFNPIPAEDVLWPVEAWKRQRAAVAREAHDFSSQTTSPRKRSRCGPSASRKAGARS